MIVRITTDNGIEGIGECYGIPFSGDIACTLVEYTFARFIEGEDPHNVETMFRKVYSAGFTQRPDVTMMGVFSGIEIAIWDILGKASEQPVYNLIGGLFHPRLRTYSYLYPRNLEDSQKDVYHDADAAAERALEYIAMGFTAIKQDPAGAHTAFRADASCRYLNLAAANTTCAESGKWSASVPIYYLAAMGR